MSKRDIKSAGRASIRNLARKVWSIWGRAEASAPWPRTPGPCLIGLSLAGLFFGWLFFDANLGIFGDNTEFIRLARSLADGETMPSSRYPVGFPAMLAAVEVAFPQSILAMKILVMVLYAASIPLIFLLLRRRSHGALPVVVCALCLLSSPLLEFSHQVMSEIPYLAVSMLALLLLDRAAERRDWRIFAAGLLAMVGAYYIRTAGVALIAAVVAAFALKRRYLEVCAVLGIMALLVLPAMSESIYMQQLLYVNPYRPEIGTLTLQSLLERIWNNLKGYGILEMPQLVAPIGFNLHPDPTWTLIVLGLLASSLLVWYLVQTVRRYDLPGIYLTCHLGLCVLWPPPWTDVRLLLPVAPLLFFGILWSGRRLARTIPRVHVVLIAILLTTNVVEAGRLHGRIGMYQAKWANYFAAGDWIRKNLPSTAVVACRKPGLMHLIARRKTVGHPFTSDPSQLIRQLEEQGVNVVVVDMLGFESTTRYLVPAILAFKGRFQILYKLEKPETYVLLFRNKKR